MCAAPGSKTAQLMEMVSAPAPDGNNAADGEVGLVVANDSDRDRAYMLAHQCKRVKSPAICITWCPAQLLPNLGAANAERGSDKGMCVCVCVCVCVCCFAGDTMALVVGGRRCCCMLFVLPVSSTG